MAARQTLQSLTERIHRAYAEMPEGERKAADLVLDRPGELALWSATELAERSGVSGATVTRFVRRLGYASYDEARRAAREMRATGSPLYLAAGSGDRAGRIARAMEIEARIVDASLALQNPLTLEAVAGVLAGAPRIRVAGFRNSYFVAEYLRTALAQFRPGVGMLAPAGQTLAEGMAALGPGDAAVVIGFRRRPAGFGAAVRALAGTGATVVLVADLSVRETPAEAHHTLMIHVETPQTVDSYAGAFAVLRLVALTVLERLDAAGRRHLERIETFHHALGDLE